MLEVITPSAIDTLLFAPNIESVVPSNCKLLLPDMTLPPSFTTTTVLELPSAIDVLLTPTTASIVKTLSFKLNVTLLPESNL